LRAGVATDLRAEGAQTQLSGGAQADAAARRTSMNARVAAVSERASTELELLGRGVRRRQRVRPVRAVRHAFRAWRRTRPFWGGLWTILGGLIILYLPATAYKFVIASGTSVWLGILVGVLIVVFGLFLWFAPSERHLMGVMIEIAALVSFVTSDLGGFLVGMLLAIIGGALGFSWVPLQSKVDKPVRVATAGQQPSRPAAAAGARD
jgi:hypothetical protein